MYYVLESATVDGKAAIAVTPKDSYAEAQMLFHQIRASALANQKVTKSLAVVLNDGGYVISREVSTPGQSESQDFPAVTDNP